MNHILIILDGILAKHFLERLCFEKGLEYFFTVVYQSDESVLDADNERLEFHKIDPTSTARLELIMRPFTQAFIYMQDEFESKKSYEALRSLDDKLEINVMDFWGLGIDDNFCNLIDARSNLSHSFLNFLPDVALTAQNIGLGEGEIMEIKIPAGSAFAYRHIGSIQQRRWRIVLIYRDSKIHFVKPSFLLQPGDSILIVGDPTVLSGIFYNIKADFGQFPVPFGTNVFTLIDMKNMPPKVQNTLIDTTLALMQKTNVRKFFIRVINPSLGQNFKRLKELSFEEDCVFFDFFHRDFSALSSFLKKNDVGLFLTDNKHFQRYKKMLFGLKIPILKIGEGDFDALTQSVILSTDKNELENQINVIVDLSKQLNLDITLYYYATITAQNHDAANRDVEEHFESLSRLYDKHIKVLSTHAQNPILSLEHRSDLLQFVGFEEALMRRSLKRALSMNLNSNHHKMRKNYQLFIPID